ncbi:AraC family transcriptional regulator [Amycolatopsis sp. GM8]|uniref:AraC family transcriptional regulator n=1 Tax=Amycolatopsis sp. GM8 TaxID=2896530 RepID=UPI001F1CC3AC|nr:AraC family transcriptional regulator [Amycolatopsis sp. GM8]
MTSESLLRTKDLDEACGFLTSVYAPHHITALDSGRFGFSLRVLNAERLRIGYSNFTSDVRLDVPPPSFYVFCYAPVGSVDVTSGHQSASVSRTTAAVLTPNAPWRFERWTDDSTLMAMRIDRADLEDDLSAILGRRVVEPITFGDKLDLTKGRGADFARVLRLLQDDDGQPSELARQHPVMASHLGQLVRSALLMSQPHNYSDELYEDRRSCLPTAIQRVVDVIEDDPMRVNSAPEIARIACISLRALEKAFVRQFGIPPMAYLRQVRLARARNELIHGDPDVLTVSAVALRWGFGHLGRFGAAYQERYGEPPSHTLRRGTRGLEFVVSRPSWFEMGSSETYPR